MIFRLLAVCALVVAALPADARADTRTYRVTFDEVASNCSQTGINLGTHAVELTETARKVRVRIPMIPEMTGRSGKDGKFKARAAKGPAGIRGVDGRFSVAGKVDANSVQLLLIAEYYVGKKPLCTQSWNGSGPKQ